MTGGLYEPLGTRPAAPPRRRGPSPLAAAGLVVAIVVAGLAILVASRSGGPGGEPQAVVSIGKPAPAPVDAAPPPPPPSAAANRAAAAPVVPGPAGPAPNPGGRAADVEIENGVRIIRMRPDAGPAFSQGAPIAAPSIPSR